ncbi:hypothetical protein [Kutzneria buriramensis]|uniref:BON domain-containing protein n=1 Tax=Kutzneria buriramensis TaxID=1045776 RepID=A0A3E0HPU0_9PSEU|nr:hypothetical protein [Kutzneria buriramensis]REH48583.1 hypothetical protein BCF44_105442 [Kutzneria buriramensis]
MSRLLGKVAASVGAVALLCATAVGTASASVADDPGGTRVPAGQVDATGVTTDIQPVVWEQDGGRTLAVVAEEGGCVRVSGRLSKQTATEVDFQVVSVVVKHVVCPQFVRNVWVTVHLDAPLGDRTVVLSTVNQ